MTAPEPSPPSPLRRRLLGAAVSAGAAVAALLVAEIAVRLLCEVTDVPAYDATPTVRRLLHPGQEGVVRRDTGDGFRARFRVNAAGFNSDREYSPDKPAGIFRVAVLGDSFVEALQVDPDRSLSAVAARTLSADGRAVEVLPFAASGLGTIDEHHLLRDVAAEFRLDAVVVVFHDNDITDCDPAAPDAPPAPEAGPPGEFVRTPRGRSLLSRSALARWLIWQQGLHRLGRTGAGHPAWRTAAVPEPEDIAAHRARAESALEHIRRFCADRNWPLVVLHVPPYHAMSYCDEEIPGREGLDFDRVGRRLSEWCAGRGVRCRRLGPDLEADHAATGGRHYLRGDGHWNAEGHAVAGRALADEIARLAAR